MSARELESQRRLAALVAREMAAAMQTLQATNPPAPRYTFKNFIICNPPKFSGIEGATALLQWFEGIESAFSISECPEPLQVRFAASLFTKRALTWWNNVRAARTLEVAHAMLWTELKTRMLAEFFPRNEVKKLEAEFWELKQIGGNNDEYTIRFHELCLLVPRLATPVSVAIEKYIDGLPPTIRDTVLGSKPSTLEDAVRLAASLTDNLVKDGDLVRTTKTRTKKRKTGDGTKTKTTEGEPKKPKTTNARVFAIPAQPLNQIPPQQLPPNQARKPYTGNWPLCATCTWHHPSHTMCRYCTRCTRYGHTDAYCRAGANLIPPPMNNQAQNQRGPRRCLVCNDVDHLVRDCPLLQQLRALATIPIPPARGRVFNINANQTPLRIEEVNDVPQLGM